MYGRSIKGQIIYNIITSIKLDEGEVCTKYIGIQLICSCIPILLTGNVPTNDVGNVPNWLGGNTIQSIMLRRGVPEIFFSLESSYFCELGPHAKN